MSVDLQGKTILVTGANGYLGQAVSYELAKLGVNTILIGPNAKSCEKIYDEIEGAGFAEPMLYPLNLEVSNEEQYVELAMSIGQQIGQLHGYIHCAGVLEKLTPIQHHDAKQWHKTLAVELTSPFLLIKNLLPLLKYSAPSKIVLLDNPNTTAGQAYWGALAAAKGGLRALAQVVQQEQAMSADLETLMVTLPAFDSPNFRKMNPGKSAQLPPVQAIAQRLAELFTKQTNNQVQNWTEMSFQQTKTLNIQTV